MTLPETPLYLFPHSWAAGCSCLSAATGEAAERVRGGPVKLGSALAGAAPPTQEPRTIAAPISSFVIIWWCRVVMSSSFLEMNGGSNRPNPSKFACANKYIFACANNQTARVLQCLQATRRRGSQTTMY